MRVIPIVVALVVLAGVAGATCGDGVLEPPDEQCDDNNVVDGDCCSSTCQFELAGSACPDDLNPCTTDLCDESGTCVHAPGNPGALCRAAAGQCDVAETCTGSDANCPADAKSTAPCRPAAGICDVAESCDGVSDDCPPDAFEPATTVCRPSAGVCDVAENCTGTDAACPVDGKSTAECRSSAGVCDVAEMCDGVGNDCPPDVHLTSAVICRPSADACDAEERCTGSANDCPPNLAQPDGTPCDDGNACTQTDICDSGSCTGTNLVVCAPLDPCHATGTCNPLTGACSNPERPDGTQCDDGNACTQSDACKDGVCDGRAVRDCCLTDAECSDGIACTVDACVSHRCMNAPLADRCGPTRECGQVLCAPNDPAADGDGCLVQAINEGSYCTEDEDPCTIDSCASSACVHTSDGSGPRCLLLVPPYRGTLELVSRAQTLETAIQAAAVAGCTRDTGPTCELPPGQESTRLIALLDATQQDFSTVAMALAGRLAGPASPSTPRDPVVRARLALGLLADTPANLRSVIATLAQARTRHLITRDFSRARRAEARRILTGTRKLRGQLLRLVTRHQSFAR